MVQKHKYIFLYLIFFQLTAYSQHTGIFMPFQFQRAYEKGTRSWDGKPGPEYCQNTARYKIMAEYDPVSRTITGSEKIIYVNNSPDTINYLVTKLLQDLYKKGNARDQDIAPELVTDEVEITLPSDYVIWATSLTLNDANQRRVWINSVYPQNKHDYSDNLTETRHESIRVWKDGKSEYKVSVKTDKKIQNIILGNEEIPDVNPKDNIWSSQENI